VRWAREVFGDNRPVIVSTHVNTGHCHNHIAVCPYDLDGHRWHSNCKSLKLVRSISDDICRRRGLSIIENPRKKSTLSYAEWLAGKNQTSWKIQMADNIDKLILRKNVTDVDSLIEEMKKVGYVFTDEKRMIAKPKFVKYGCRISKLGCGYSRDYLEQRIANKQYELLGRDLWTFGYNIDFAVCIKNIQFETYRAIPDRKPKDDHDSLMLNFETLCYVHNKELFSVESFKLHLDILDNEEKHLEQVIEARRYGGIYHDPSDIDRAHRELEEFRERLANIKEEKKRASKYFLNFQSIMENDYEKIMREERSRSEAERCKDKFLDYIEEQENRQQNSRRHGYER
jgi:hypothetical protein